MKNKQWSTEDRSYLIDNYKSISIEELVIRLERTETAIRWKAKQLGLTMVKLDYSEDEDAFILQNFKKITIDNIAQLLGRTKTSVNKRLYKIRARTLPNFRETMVDIEPNVPFENNLSEGYRVALSRLNIGDSFVFPKSHYVTIQNQKCFFKTQIFATKSIDKENSRLWRIA